jgi:hypothetical protein
MQVGVCIGMCLCVYAIINVRVYIGMRMWPLSAHFSDSTVTVRVTVTVMVTVTVTVTVSETVTVLLPSSFLLLRAKS